MLIVKKIVLTGGSSGGKTTTIAELRKVFSKEVAFIPEVATIILSSGPFAYKQMSLEEKWQFQKAILVLQKAIEEAFEHLSVHASIAVCECGLLDGAAYVSGGLKTFCRYFNLDEQKVFAQYTTVIHLESIATGAPSIYKRTANNPFRYETLEEAKTNEYALRMVWQKHPNYHFVSCEKGLEGKISYVQKVIEELLASKK